MQYFTLNKMAASLALVTAARGQNETAVVNVGDSESAPPKLVQLMSEVQKVAAATAGTQDLSQLEAWEKSLTQNDMGLLNNYGCWCFFESNHGKGRGHPVDDIDQYCKTLHDGYECVMADAEDQGIDNCIPWEVSYNSAFGGGIPGGLTMQGLSAECDINNTPNSCEAMACKVEGWFVQQYFLYSTQGGTINSVNRHEEGFDTQLGCPISTGVQSEKGCCGEYPVRFPYKTYGGQRDCCVSHTYNANMYECCNDGHVRMTC